MLDWGGGFDWGGGLDWGSGLWTLYIISFSPVAVTTGTTTTELDTAPLVRLGAMPREGCGTKPARSCANGTLIGQANQSDEMFEVGVTGDGWLLEERLMVDGRLLIVTVDGRLLIATVDGRLLIATVDGRLLIATVDGRLLIATVDGRLLIATVDGRLLIATDDGRLLIATDDGRLLIATDDGRLLVAMVDGRLLLVMLDAWLVAVPTVCCTVEGRLLCGRLARKPLASE